MLRPLEKGGRSTAYEVNWSLGEELPVDAERLAMEKELAEVSEKWAVIGLDPKA